MMVRRLTGSEHDPQCNLTVHRVLVDALASRSRSARMWPSCPSSG